MNLTRNQLIQIGVVLALVISLTSLILNFTERREINELKKRVMDLEPDIGEINIDPGENETDPVGSSLDIDILGEGNVNITPDKDAYKHDEEVNLTAEPEEGWCFVEWEWEGEHIKERTDTSKQKTITMIHADREFKASFSEKEGIADITLKEPEDGEKMSQPNMPGLRFSIMPYEDIKYYIKLNNIETGETRNDSTEVLEADACEKKDSGTGFGIDSGNYSWKVVAESLETGEIKESETRTFEFILNYSVSAP